MCKNGYRDNVSTHVCTDVKCTSTNCDACMSVSATADVCGKCKDGYARTSANVCVSNSGNCV